MGFYGLSVFLQILHLTRGWPVAIIPSAITVHFLLSALIITVAQDPSELGDCIDNDRRRAPFGGSAGLVGGMG
jgi:hypothetical protein